MTPLVIALYDFTGNSVNPWAEAGYECWLVDLRHPPGVGPLAGNIRRIGADVRDFELPEGREIAFMFAWPPCTHLAVSGARWFLGKGLDALADSIRMVAAAVRLCEASWAPYLIENPVGTLASYWRPPDYKFDPCDYAVYSADPASNVYRKRTCLWVGGGFVMPRPRRAASIYRYRMRSLVRHPDARSVTPDGFCRAVFEANRPGANAHSSASAV